MGRNTTGLSRDLIIHPGETLIEVLESRNMTQKDLATKTASSQQHINRVIKGTTNISPGFAKKLEYVLGINASFWINLQANYDLELAELEEANQISQQEIDIVKSLKKVIDCLIKMDLIKACNDIVTRVIELRKFSGIANLTTIPRLLPSGSYRVSKNKIDIYVMFVWHKLCDRILAEKDTSNVLDIDKLIKKLPDIKKLMLNDEPSVFLPKLEKSLDSCGISFCVVPHFTGAPVQGFIKEAPNGSINLCLTIRGKRADTFWFTLFHEIGHIINGDFDGQFTDFDSGFEITEAEDKADIFARDLLINLNSYKAFIDNADFSINAINKFALQNKIPSYIVIGRLQKEEYISWSQFRTEITMYEWSN